MENNFMDGAECYKINIRTILIATQQKEKIF